MTVFVSYSSRDRDAVKSLTQDLQDADEQVWMDQRLAGGQAWWRAILDQIRGCDVFIFALSQNSIESKPCQAELQYAQALGLSILPVQVGPVDSMQLNPLATVQAIDYRTSTAKAAMRLISALHRERACRQPLPDPLPPEPPVPFEYLIRLYTTISNPDYLSPPDQAALVAQLQFGLREDGQHEAARRDIVMLLQKLRDRKDITYQTRIDVDAILASIDAQSLPSPPIATDTITPVEEQVGVIPPPVSTGAPTETEHEPADKEDTTLNRRRTHTALPPEPDDHHVTVAPSGAGLTSTQTLSETSDVSVAPATGTPGPSVKQTWFRRQSRRTKIALISGGVAVVAIVVAVVLAIVLPSGVLPSGPQVVLPFSGLDDPAGVAVDAAGNLYVTDYGNHRVLKLAAGAATQQELQFTDLSHPDGVAVDAAGNLYVTDDGNNRVLRLPAGSNTPVELPFTGLSQTSYSSAPFFGVAVDAAGTVYVTDAGGDRVVKLAAGSTTQEVLPFTGLKDPKGVAVDAAGTVYVTDGWAADRDRVVKLAAGSTTQEVLPLTGLKDPKGVAVDAAGTVYVTDDGGGDRVVKLAAGSTTQEVLPFTGLSGLGPYGVAVDAAGTVYVADKGNNRVVKLPVQ